jgi:3-methyladenine DNA glycosylase AlkD
VTRDPSSIDAAEVLEKLETLGDVQRRDFAKGNYPTALRVVGIKNADLRCQEKDLLRRLRDAPADQVLELAKKLVGSGVLEAQRVAYEILDRHQAAAASLELADIEALAVGLDNWVSVDSFAGLVAGPAWREGRVPDDVVHGWARSRDRWWRRVAVVCTVALNQKARGGAGDPDRTLAVCRMVAEDHDEMVTKSLSWALRELAKRDAAPVGQFLAEHDEVLAARVKREVRRKIETGRK